MGTTLTFEGKIDTVKTKLDKFGGTEASIMLKVASGDPESDFGPLTGLHGSKVKITLEEIDGSVVRREEF